MLETLTDNDTSATCRKPRTAFKAMLEAADGDEFDVIMAYHLDRLMRTMRDLLPLQALADDHGVKVCTVSGGLDMTTHMGSTLAGILIRPLEVRKAEVESRVSHASRTKVLADLIHATNIERLGAR